MPAEATTGGETVPATTGGEAVATPPAEEPTTGTPTAEEATAEEPTIALEWKSPNVDGIRIPTTGLPGKDWKDLTKSQTKRVKDVWGLLDNDQKKALWKELKLPLKTELMYDEEIGDDLYNIGIM